MDLSDQVHKSADVVKESGSGRGRFVLVVYLALAVIAAEAVSISVFSGLEPRLRLVVLANLASGAALLLALAGALLRRSQGLLFLFLAGAGGLHVLGLYALF